jgi:hypothetical protein
MPANTKLASTNKEVERWQTIDYRESQARAASRAAARERERAISPQQAVEQSTMKKFKALKGIFRWKIQIERPESRGTGRPETRMGSRMGVTRTKPWVS